MSFSSFDEVSTTMGIMLSVASDLICFNTSSPSIFGNFRSSSITAGLSLERSRYSPRQCRESSACSPSRATITSLARLYSSSAVRVSSTSLGSSSTNKIRPRLLIIFPPVFVVSELRNRKSPRHRRHLPPRPCLHDDGGSAEPWLIQCQYFRRSRSGAGAEIRQTIYSHISYQNP